MFNSFWDDWIRQPEQRKNRACIRPEVSRTKTFGKKGVSKLVQASIAIILIFSFVDFLII